MSKLRTRQLAVAGLFALVGASILAFLFVEQRFPNVAAWLVFAAAFVYLEWRSVEVHDRLSVSPSVMVTLTAAVVFGPGEATLGAAAMAAAGPLTPTDVRERRWFQPLVNFGQQVISASIAIWVLERYLPETVTAGNLWLVALGAAVAAAVHGLVQFTLVAWIVKTVYLQRNVRPWAQMGANHLSFFTMGFLGGLLGATYLIVGPHTLPLIFATYLVGHMAFASYAELREAQEATLRGFVKALEAKDVYTRGHSERVAYFAQLIGEELRYSPTRLQRLRWAALIHDVGKLAVPRRLIRKPARLTRDEYELMQRHVHVVEDLLAEVEFLHPIVRIASGHHAHFDGSGYAGPGHGHGQALSEDTSVLAVADAFDAMTSSRSYRTALSQEYALEELASKAGSQFDPHVVAALERALQRTDERYGSDHAADEEEARRQAEAAAQEAVHG